MTQSSDVSYFKIGLFVLLGLSLAIISLLIFGSNKLFQKTIYLETYFEESVQGISEGYPVKYRGLQIGYVKKIAFTNEIYKNFANTKSEKLRSRSIYILLAITSDLFTQQSKEDLTNMLTNEVASGLRVKIMPQGLTGTTYIELNYVDPTTNHLPKVTWQPEYFYIPSSPGVFTQISNNMERIFNQIKDVDFKKIFINLGTVTESIGEVTQKTNHFLDTTNQPITKALQNMQEVSENLRTLSQQLKLYPAQLIFGETPQPLDLNKL